MQMSLEYAKQLLETGSAFGHRVISFHDGLLVVDDNERWMEDLYFGTQMIDGEFQVNERNMVTFKRVTPVVDENTRFA